MVQRNMPANKQQQIRMIQIIAAALIMGVVFFGVIATFIVTGHEPDPEEAAGTPIVGYMAAGMGAMMLVLQAVVPNIAARGQLQIAFKDDHPPIDEVDWLQVRPYYGAYQLKVIIGLAMIEAAVFFSWIAFIIHKEWWIFGVAAALIAIMALNFPTTRRIEEWVENQRQAINMGR